MVLVWRYGLERGAVTASPSMNLVEEVKRAYRLNDKELSELETGIERMELERQMSHDTLDLLMEKVRRVFVCTLYMHCVQRQYEGVSRTDKKDKEIFIIYKEIQMGLVTKSLLRKGFLKYEEMRKYLTIFEEAVSHL